MAIYLNDFQLVDMKQQNRFVFRMSPANIASWHVKATSLPQIENNPITIDTPNSEYKIKGKSRWQDITISLYDPIVKSAAKEVHDWILSHHESSNDKDHYMDRYKREITIQYIDPAGEDIEAWKLHGAFVASANWGDLDVSSDDLVSLELTLTYDWAELITRDKIANFEPIATRNATSVQRQRPRIPSVRPQA